MIENMLSLQKKRLTLCALISFATFTACVDNQYDLSDINTDGTTIGDEWVSPLGTGTISIKKLIDFDKVQEIRPDENGNYIARYSGNLSADLTDFIEDLRPPFAKSVEYVSVADTRIDLRDAMNLFDSDDLVLSFADPRIKMETKSNFPISLNSILNIESERAGKIESTSTEFEFASFENKLWIGADKNAVSTGFTFIENKDLNNLIKIAPDVLKLDLGLDLSNIEIASLPDNPRVDLNYTVEIPFAPAADFKAILNQSIDDAFDEDFVDYVFSGGTATIAGKVSNDFPLGFSMNLVITDEMDRPVGINFAPAQVTACTSSGAASVSEISFLITERDMEKMATARNIQIELLAKGDAATQGVCLNEKQEITLDLKLKKTGGIVINSSK